MRWRFALANEEQEQALATFNHAAEELRFFKGQQWHVANYVLIAYAALVATPRLAENCALGKTRCRKSVMRACAALGMREAFTSYNNPKGNTNTERFLRTLKEELVWLREWTSPTAFFAALDRWLAGSPTTTPVISIRRSATERRMSLKR